MGNYIAEVAATIIIDCLILSVLLMFPVYLLWNWLIPSMFNLGQITILQSLGICLLCRLLFGKIPRTPSKE